MKSNKANIIKLRNQVHNEQKVDNSSEKHRKKGNAIAKSNLKQNKCLEGKCQKDKLAFEKQNENNQRHSMKNLLIKTSEFPQNNGDRQISNAETIKIQDQINLVVNISSSQKQEKQSSIFKNSMVLFRIGQDQVTPQNYQKKSISHQLGKEQEECEQIKSGIVQQSPINREEAIFPGRPRAIGVMERRPPNQKKVALEMLLPCKYTNSYELSFS